MAEVVRHESRGLEVADLSVAYGRHRALEDVAIDVSPGEICVILGANGAGKSTLLKSIAGMVRPQAGARVRMAGREIAGEKPHRIVEAGLALVPEGRGIFGDLTVAENLQLGAYGPQARGREAERLARVLELFPKLGERRGQVARTMSGGEQQMVAIGRALMSNPQILMLDEPSLGLSPLLTRELFRSLSAIRETGVGILLVEQNAKQSLAIADRGYLIENGHITGEGRADRLAGDPAVQAAYLGGAVAAPASAIAAPAAASVAASMPHRLTEPAQPPASGGTAEALAARAAAIQRNYLEQLRGRSGTVALPFHDGGMRPLPAPAPLAAARPSSAAELGRQAEDFARRAREIQLAHIAEIRSRTSIWSVLSRSRPFQEDRG